MSHMHTRAVGRTGRWWRSRFAVSMTALAVATSVATVHAPVAIAAEPVVTENGWSYIHESLETGQGFGFQLALDPVERTVYLSDMRARTDRLDPDTGEITTNVEPTGKLVEFDTATRQLVRNHDFNGLSRIDGSGPNSASPAASFFNANNTYSSLRTDFGTYGVALDPNTVYDGVRDTTIITTTARQRSAGAPVLDDQGNPVLDANGDPVTRDHGGGVVVYRASQGAPTDADRIFEFDDGVPVLQGPRRIAVNTLTHKAYVTSLGTQRNNGAQPGFITQIDLLTKTVEARIAVPEGLGAVGVAVDEVNNLIYMGAMARGGLYVIDGDAVDTSNPKDVTLNADAVTRLAAEPGSNQRPTYSPADQRLYISAYDDQTITIVDADPDSATYGQTIHTIETGPTNAVEIDGERGLLYSAELGAQEVVVYDTETFEPLLALPTSGNALNIGIDPVTRDVWVSNWNDVAKVDVFEVIAPDDEPGEPGEDEIEYVKWDGARYWAPETWTEGQPLRIRGEGWLNVAGNAGSTIAVKLNFGSIEPINPLDPPPGVNPDILEDVWAIIDADADGNWTAELPYPSADRTDNPVVVGDDVELNLLTGSLQIGDKPRGAPSGPPPDGNPVVRIVVDDGGEPGEPGEPVEGDITVTFGVDAGGGGLSLHIADDVVDLGVAQLNETIDRLVAEGALPAVTVADTREGDLPWSVTGASSAFADAPGASLGWAPEVVSVSAGQVVTEGPVVDPSTGLTGGSTLASASAGESRGTAVLGADLRVEAPSTTPAGSYSAVITLTLS